MSCAKQGEAKGSHPWRAERQSRSRGKPRPIRVAAKCRACFLICQLRLLGIVAQATTFVARLAFIRILPATQSAWGLFRGSLVLRSQKSAPQRGCGAQDCEVQIAAITWPYRSAEGRRC